MLGIVGLFLCLAVVLDLGAAEVQITADARAAESGDRIRYLLVTPKEGAASFSPPYPAVILTHGFGRDYGRHIDKAIHYAENGLVVFVPNLLPSDVRLVAHRRNVANTVDHFRWLVERTEDPLDPLFGLIDPRRIALAGHSAGGAISVEAAWALQRRGARVAALVMLDGVPSSSTEKAAMQLAELPFLSIRSEPSACNAFGAIDSLLAVVPFPVIDIRVLGSTHCAAEGPTDVTCELLCGRSPAGPRQAYELLALSFFNDTLGRSETVPPFEATLQILLEDRAVAMGSD